MNGSDGGIMPEGNDASMQLCSVETGGRLFGIDTREIREVLGDARARRVPLAPAHIAGVLTYRGEVLTVVELRSLLGLGPKVGTSRILVLEDRELGEPFGLAVDAVGGVLHVPLGGMERNPATLEALESALLNGLYQTDRGLMARLEVARLRPLYLARSAMSEAQAMAR